MRKLVLGAAILTIVAGFAVFSIVQAAGPVISYVSSNVLSDRNSVLISWATNVTATGKVLYGTSSGNLTSTASVSGSSTSFAVTIKDLSYSTKYYFKVVATDLNGESTESEESTFTTGEKDLVFKRVDVIDVTSNQTYLVLVENKGAEVSVKYGTDPNNLNLTAAVPASDPNLPGQPHQRLLQNLQSNTIYYFQATAKTSSGETATSDQKSFTTTGVPTISGIEPDEGPNGTVVTITGKNFGSPTPLEEGAGTPDDMAGGVGFGCTVLDETFYGPSSCAGQLISWSDTKIVAKTTTRARTGAVLVSKWFYWDYRVRADFFTVSGPTFTVTKEESTPQPTTNTNTSGTSAAQYVESAYGCAFSTSTQDDQTIKVKKLFTKGGDKDKYFSDVYEAYKQYFERVPRCTEMQFHSDHGTGIARLTEWLKSKQAITEKFGCKISTTAAADDTLRVKSPLKLNDDIDQYLAQVYEAYVELWARSPRCTEMQFHLDNGTAAGRLTAWMKQQASGPEGISGGTNIEFALSGTKVVPKDTAKKQVKSTDRLTFSGTAATNTTVVLTVASDPLTFTTQSDKDGKWSYSLPGPLENGDHTVKVAVLDSSGKTVNESDAVAFEVVDQTAQQTAAAVAKTNATWYLVALVALVLIFLLVFMLMRKATPPTGQK